MAFIQGLVRSAQFSALECDRGEYFLSHHIHSKLRFGEAPRLIVNGFVGQPTFPSCFLYQKKGDIFVTPRCSNNTLPKASGINTTQRSASSTVKPRSIKLWTSFSSPGAPTNKGAISSIF